MNGRVLALVLAVGCAGDDTATPEPAPTPDPVPVAAQPKGPPAGPLPALLMVQAHFPNKKPGPAKMMIYRTDGEQWWDETIEDPDSNVFHKAMGWRDGVLTIGAMKAKLKHWTRDGDGWKGTTLWEKSWGGKFDRLRDIEVADVDGDGADEIVLATHDMGVVAVGDEAEDGTWTFQEFDQKADTFVHEVEVGDVDGDGKAEFYVTPSERNKSSGASQPGGVARYTFDGTTYKRSQVIQWDTTHAKEILVTDLDGDGRDELYVAKEAHIVKEGKKKTLKDPVHIVRMDVEGGTWSETIVATLKGEHQCRFLVPGDVNHDGKIDLVASGKDKGLFVLVMGDDGTLTPEVVDRNSGGFEHTTHVADLDGDGKVEIYVANEKKGLSPELRRYTWTGTAWDRAKIADIPEEPSHITWNLQDARL